MPINVPCLGVLSTLGQSERGQVFWKQCLWPRLNGVFNVLNGYNLPTVEEPWRRVARVGREIERANLILVILDWPVPPQEIVREMERVALAGKLMIGCRDDNRPIRYRGKHCDNVPVERMVKRSGGVIVPDIEALIMVLREHAQRLYRELATP